MYRVTNMVASALLALGAVSFATTVEAQRAGGNGGGGAGASSGPSGGGASMGGGGRAGSPSLGGGGGRSGGPGVSGGGRSGGPVMRGGGRDSLAGRGSRTEGFSGRWGGRHAHRGGGRHHSHRHWRGRYWGPGFGWYGPRYGYYDSWDEDCYRIKRRGRWRTVCNY
jgi:hypothetical protein